MSGTGVLGGNGYSEEAIRCALETFRRVYFVEGNHDLESSFSRGFRNEDGSHCHVSGRVQEVEDLGWITGLDGVISNKKKNQRRRKSDYLSILGRLTKGTTIDWLLTHDIPLIEEITDFAIGHRELRDLVVEEKVQHHLFGHHCFSWWQGKIEETRFINVDSRIVFLSQEPLGLFC